ncbi:MAG: hypothetical protein HYT07_03935 [Candidatus Levybacteria bacterium]|nr:hypothetical protein [Candidatus Levybacteria bacterium]
MENRVNTDIQSLKIIYNRNKYFIVPTIVVFVCLALVILVIIPQIKTLFVVQEEARNASQKLSTLRNNLGTLENLDVGLLESQLRTSTLALPINKDFGGILNAIFFASQKTGVRIGRFSFAVGELTQGEQEEEQEEEQKEEGSTSTGLTVTLDSDIGAVNSFITEIQKTLPLSEIGSVTTDSNSSTVTLLFYYKVLPVASLLKNLTINSISQEKLSLLSKMESFNNTSLIDFSPSPSTSSAIKSTNPFLE